MVGRKVAHTLRIMYSNVLHSTPLGSFAEWQYAAAGDEMPNPD